ncbi:hypothetical protein EAJ17_01775 [Akkermansia sp. aa_0143]|nr:hypothetical protein EAJ17_01775 [Akkermansia sp. aa_0143]
MEGKCLFFQVLQIKYSSHSIGGKRFFSASRTRFLNIPELFIEDGSGKSMFRARKNETCFCGVVRFFAKSGIFNTVKRNF